ncbi:MULTISPECIES: hypothetical protein [Edaphosphingomonas]|uniref:Uncharacterized protein n=1 Tax=Edaphosphingomonas haloaromaticamans TaxID=653954 RepID=A0A1S1HLI9_9SPHN|nr:MULTISPECIES: hypothetical protein [Sphingomonas]MDX3884153.1 hypothetical protein [Sphingomonas sp.]OHT22266.1 hypothetical protein BHE75_04292 [Sphingomonas haloaromaticamans]
MGIDRDFIWRRYIEECAAAKTAKARDAQSAHQHLASRFGEQIRIMRSGRPPNLVI